MAKLNKYILFFDAVSSKWDLMRGSGDTVKSFKAKTDATKGGALAKAIGAEGGSVRIKKRDGKIQ